MVTQHIALIPPAVSWRNGMVLEPDHFLRSDARAASLSHLAALVADPWPWGFLLADVDQVALVAGELKVTCAGVFPNGTPFGRTSLSASLGKGEDGDSVQYEVVSNSQHGTPTLQRSSEATGEDALEIARLYWRNGAWTMEPSWSPPALLLGTDHPMRGEMNIALGELAALGVGFITTMRMPSAENRPIARVLGQVAITISQGVGVMEALLASPSISPGRLGLEALRLSLGVRTAAGIFEPLEGSWSPHDQRGSMRMLLSSATAAASSIGLPFRANVFKAVPGNKGVLEVEVVDGRLLLAIEAVSPTDLSAARNWFDGAALAAPDRIQEALTRRVGGCRRRRVERDTSIGVSSGPLLALYEVADDLAWRAGKAKLALSAKSAPPANCSFSILIPERAPGQMDEGVPPSSAVFGDSRLSGSSNGGYK